VDDSTLDLLSLALDPGEDAERTSVGDFLDFLSQMGGSDTTAVDHVSIGPHPFIDGESVEWHHMRDAAYHEHDVMRALIAEVRRLRADVEAKRQTLAEIFAANGYHAAETEEGA